MIQKGRCPMKYILNQYQMQEIDRITIEEMGVLQPDLMEQAAKAVYDVVTKCEMGKRPILILAGGGNNGGDGLALTRMLWEAGYSVTLCVVGDMKKSKGFVNQWDRLMTCMNSLEAKHCQVLEIYTAEAFANIAKGKYSVIVDSMFGVGLSRDLKAPFDDIINMVNGMKGIKIALDIPSGLHGTTGRIMGTAFGADMTVTFGYRKLGMVLGDGPNVCGSIVVKKIGFAKEALDSVQPDVYTMTKKDLKRLPKRTAVSNKGSYGKVAVFAGNRDMAGAAYFSAAAAYRMGTGLVKVYSHGMNRDILLTKLPEAMFRAVPSGAQVSSNAQMMPAEDLVSTWKEEARQLIQEVNAWANVMIIGPGIGTDAWANVLVETALEMGTVPMVIDADGLNILAKHPEWLRNKQAPVVVTPHMGEMSRLTNLSIANIKQSPIEVAKTFAKDYDVICVLKDAKSVVAKEGKKTYVNISGNNGMATGGSGDVLTGIIAGLVAGGKSPYRAATLGCLVHGMAGDYMAEKKGVRSLLAGDLLDGIIKVLRKW